ncbi:MAG: alginate export family protein, partial [Actinomycetota bacterium]
WRARNLGSPANSARLGRFEVVDGMETAPQDPSLGFLKRERVAHRLLGTFGFTHIGRSFDGGQFVHNTPDLNVTLFGGMPTKGVFDLDGGTTLDDIKVGYAALTKPFKADGFQAETRLFGLHYVDDRQGVVKVDNRPAPVRAADTRNVSISTVGGHAIGVWDTPGGKVDALLWAAGQFGEFGSQSHSAFALAVEAGYQPKDAPWSPWLRAGFNRYSGDDDPMDGNHGAFFPVLPTPRIYARFPFFTLSNLNDAFAQVVLKPTPRLTLRSDLHALWLAEKNDLWYIGGGAFQRPTFGYGGRPSNMNTGLATLIDLSADFQVRKYTTVSGYIGYAFGGDVVDSIYSGSNNGFLGYVELTQKF